MQKEQVQARAGISVGAGSHSNLKEMFPQWQLPPMSTDASCARVTTPNVQGNRRAALPPAEDQGVYRRVRLTVVLGPSVHDLDRIGEDRDTARSPMLRLVASIRSAVPACERARTTGRHD